MAAKRLPEDVVQTILEFLPKDRDARGRIRDCAELAHNDRIESRNSFSRASLLSYPVVLRQERATDILWTIYNPVDPRWYTSEIFRFAEESTPLKVGHWEGPGLGPGRYMTKDGEGHPVPDLETLKQKSPQWIRKQEGAIEVWAKA